MSLLGLIVFFPMVGAALTFLSAWLDRHLRDALMVATALAEFVILAILLLVQGASGGSLWIPGICGRGLYFTTDGFRALYGTIAAFMWMMASLFSLEYFAHTRNRNRYYLSWLLTLGATEGIFFSGDLYTTFIFFEMMSFCSYVWVAQDEKPASLRAAATYLAVAVIGGLVMLMGLFLLDTQAGTLVIADLANACAGKNVYAACACLFFGFAAKAGAFPLHIWLPKAHPVAPAPASALLSGILTKTGVFGIVVISGRILHGDGAWGTFVLIIGALTMLAGAVLALFSVDLKRTLACSSVSQIGFVLVAIGMMGISEGNALPAQGALLHMVNHSLWKLVLFLAAGAVYCNVHKLDLNEIRGFGHNKPFLLLPFLSAALGIGGVPLFSGYISKTLIHESIVERARELQAGAASGILGASDLKIIEWLFLISGGMTVAYMCKLFVAVFVEKNADANVQARYDKKTRYLRPAGKLALAVPSVLFPLFGLFPHVFLDGMASLGQGFFGVSGDLGHVAYFSFANLGGALISIAIGAAVYLLVVRGLLMKKEGGVSVYVNRWPEVFDLENYVYRPILLGLLPAVGGFFCGILDRSVDVIAKTLPIAGNVEASFFDTIADTVVVFLRKTIYKDSPQPHELEEGNFLTHFLGGLANKVVALLNHTLWRDHPNTKDYEHQLALAYDSFKENTGLIGRSLSYGLILFCLGLCGTLIYLLVGLLG